MQERGLLPPLRHRVAFLTAVLAVVALDQLTKELALNALADGPIELVGSLQLRLTANAGAAFSLGSGKTTWIALVAIGVSVVLARMGWQAERRLVAVGWGTIVGGALGNVVDRLFREGDGFLGGHVVDFVDLGWWPVFNLADSALWVGIGLLLIASWRERDEERGKVAA